MVHQDRLIVLNTDPNKARGRIQTQGPSQAMDPIWAGAGTRTELLPGNTGRNQKAVRQIVIIRKEGLLKEDPRKGRARNAGSKAGSKEVTRNKGGSHKEWKGMSAPQSVTGHQGLHGRVVKAGVRKDGEIVKHLFLIQNHP